MQTSNHNEEYFGVNRLLAYPWDQYGAAKNPSVRLRDDETIAATLKNPWVFLPRVGTTSTRRAGTMQRARRECLASPLAIHITRPRR